MLSDREIEAFVSDGFVALRGAVPSSIATACCDVIWEILHRRGFSRDDPSTWSEPVVRIPCPEGGPFVEAGTSGTLWEAYDCLLGPGRWERRPGVGGTVPVRFPSETDPGDAGWHFDSSYQVSEEWRVNVRTRGRGLLALFLFTDVTEADVPTRILVGSHLDVPGVLAQWGDEGITVDSVMPRLPASTFERRIEPATGRAGDVYLCHPFLVHAASWPHRGQGARIIAQPGVALHEPLALDPNRQHYPVERAVLAAGLAGAQDEPSGTVAGGVEPRSQRVELAPSPDEAVRHPSTEWPGTARPVS